MCERWWLPGPDNLAEVCAAEKGWARDLGLRTLLRRAAAMTLAAEIRWKRRYVESGRGQPPRTHAQHQTADAEDPARGGGAPESPWRTSSASGRPRRAGGCTTGAAHGDIQFARWALTPSTTPMWQLHSRLPI